MWEVRQVVAQLPKVLLLCMSVYIMSNMSTFTRPAQGGHVLYHPTSYESLNSDMLPALSNSHESNNNTVATAREKKKEARRFKKQLKREARQRVKEVVAQVKELAATSVMTYAAECRWSYEPEQGGYPLVAFEGQLGTYVCPSMFRDMSDYVFGWPFSHFGEDDVYVMDRGQVPDNLPPVPIIYSHTDHVRKGELGQWLQGALKRPYILVTGQSDWAIPSSTSNADKVLRDPNLVRWFAQNNDVAHDKITPIPIGLNCFEHAPEMQETRELITSTRPDKTDLLLVNFGNSHPDREKVWKYFCEPAPGQTQFATCLTKTQPNNIKGNPHLVQFYQDVSSFQYVVCPRGNGLDTHRVWEALYLGVIPILLHSPLEQQLYHGLPVLFVDRYEDVTPDLLQAKLPELTRKMRKWDGSQLQREYWWGVVEAARTAALQELKVADASARKRCWGKK